jgi:hypothetical protein
MLDQYQPNYLNFIKLIEIFRKLNSENFDENKLKPIVTEIGERVEIITGFYYNEVDLLNYKEYGDYWSKGITYYLN